MSIINHRINASDVYIYPSANALDGGEINTEENISSLADRFFFKNYVIKRENDETPGMSLSSDGTTLIISKGECCINGRYINLKEQSIDTSVADFDGHSIQDGVVYYILLVPHYDLTGCLIGDIRSIPAPGQAEQVFCAGVSIDLSTTLEQNALYLGTLIKNGSTLTVEENPNKNSIIDMSQVAVGGEDIESLITRLIQQAMSNLGSLTLINKTDVTNSPILLLKYNNTEGWVRNTGSGTQVYFKTPTGVSSILISPSGLVYDNGITSMNIIQEILDLKNNQGGGSAVNLAPANGVTSTGDGGRTTNGTATLAARADHFHQNYIIGTRASNLQTISTNLTVNGDITGNRVYNAVWNDYADAVLKANNTTTEPGDIIAKDEYSDGYVLATSYNAKLVVGVHSDTYGHLLGGDKDATLEENLNKYIPIALAGNVKVKVVGRVKIGDFIVASFIPGVGVASNGYVPGTIVGKALENKDTDDMSRILMQVMLI